MSDKLQKIKDRIDDIMMHGKERRSAQLQLMYANGEIEWLIEQLEQAQTENSHIKATLDKFEYSDSPTQEELIQAYKEIYKGKPVGFFIEQLESYIKDLIGELKQAQAEAKKWRKQAHEEIELGESIVAEREALYAEVDRLKAENEQLSKQLEECMGSHEKLEAACHRLKEDKRKLQAVHDENYAKAAHRAGVIEELQAANQKLVECLEWYGDYEHYQTNVVDQWQPVNPVMSDLGERARNTLSEVKGDG